MQAGSRTFLAATLAAAACGCGTVALPPEAAPLAAGERVAVVYEDGGIHLTLRNASSLRVDAAYGGGSDRGLKVAPDHDVDLLLEGLARTGFFDGTMPSASAQARASLTVVRGGRTHARCRLPLAASSAAEIERFGTFVDLFRLVYDSTDSFHTGATTDFDDRTRRLLENAQQAAREKGRK